MCNNKIIFVFKISILSHITHTKGQLIRCSTSVAANYRAARLGQSKATFIAKISIVVEEADEAEFWLEFIIIEEKLLKEESVISLKNEAHELASIFVKSNKTAQLRKDER